MKIPTDQEILDQRDRLSASIDDLGKKLLELKAQRDQLLAALKGYMDILGTNDAISDSKKSVERRASLWKEAKAAIRSAEGADHA